MDPNTRRINRNMIIGWMVIAIVLLVSYVGEVIKGTRTLAYLIVFLAVVFLPLLVSLFIYAKKSDWKQLCYVIVPGYFVMYFFVMFTGSTSMVFSYILPMLSLLVLYHHPNLILATGLASLVVNLVSIAQKFRAGVLNITNSRDAEIQLALILLCFGGSYLAARLYDDITKQNNSYLNMLNNKNRQIQKMTTQTITAIANTLDAKDTYTEGHSERVSLYCVQLARALGMNEEEIESLRLIALMHDIGKIGIPDSVLNKHGRLSEEEFALMKQHPVIGGEIIKDISMIPDIFIGARYHHERYDGKGYPEGLKGENIPYIARIIAVADAYDAMTSDRVYRSALTEEQVMSELENGVGTQFDPVISRLLIELLHTGAMKNLSPDKRKSAAQAAE